MAGNDRRVTLLKGEAFFQVTPDPSRPFRVVAGDVETRVVGTSFNVRRDAEGVAVSVEEGVWRSPLRPNRKCWGRVTRSGCPGAARRSARACRRSSSPPGGRDSSFSQDRPIGEAVDQLRRYYGGAIIVAGNALAAKSVTGAYNLHDPEDALRGMARAHGAKVRHISPRLIVMSDD